MEIVKRPQAIRTGHRFFQPPHRVVDSAYHLGVLLRRDIIATSSLHVNAEFTELPGKFCEMKN